MRPGEDREEKRKKKGAKRGLHVFRAHLQTDCVSPGDQQVEDGAVRSGRRCASAATTRLFVLYILLVTLVTSTIVRDSIHFSQ